MVQLPLASAGLNGFLFIFHCGEAEVALVSRTISSCLSVCLSEPSDRNGSENCLFICQGLLSHLNCFGNSFMWPLPKHTPNTSCSILLFHINLC